MVFSSRSWIIYIDNPTTGRKYHNKRKEFETNMFKYGPKYLNDMYKTLSGCDMGREFVIIAKLRV